MANTITHHFSFHNLPYRYYLLLILCSIAGHTLAQPVNDSCAAAIPLPCDTTFNGTTSGATFDNVGFCGTSNTAAGVWYVVQGNGGTITASTCNQAAYDTKISVFTGTCSGLTCVGGQDDAAGCAGFTTNYTWQTNPLLTYYILVHGFGSASGNFTLTISSSITTQDTLIICPGDSALLGGAYQDTLGTYVDSLLAVGGCDSIIFTTLLFHDTIPDAYDTLEICIGDSVFLAGAYQSTAGLYTDVFASNLTGCDSLVYTLLNINSHKDTFHVSDTICQGDGVLLGGNWQMTSGIYYDLHASAGGCPGDSVIATALTVTPVDTSVTNPGVISLMANAASTGTASFQWVDCNNGYQAISGETSDTFTASANGNYAVIVTQNGCTDTSGCHAITGVGLSEQLLSGRVEVFPNPANDHLFVTFEQPQPIRMRVRSIAGQTIYSHNFPASASIRLDTPWAPGLYLLEITGNSGEQTVIRILKK